MSLICFFVIELTVIFVAFGQSNTTGYSDEADTHTQQLSIKGILLTAISIFVNETYSPPRNLIKSFFRSKFVEYIFFCFVKYKI